MGSSSEAAGLEVEIVHTEEQPATPGASGRLAHARGASGLMLAIATPPAGLAQGTRPLAPPRRASQPLVLPLPAPDPVWTEVKSADPEVEIEIYEPPTVAMPAPTRLWVPITLIVLAGAIVFAVLAIQSLA